MLVPKQMKAVMHTQTFPLAQHQAARQQALLSVDQAATAVLATDHLALMFLVIKQTCAPLVALVPVSLLTVLIHRAAVVHLGSTSMTPTHRHLVRHARPTAAALPVQQRAVTAHATVGISEPSQAQTLHLGHAPAYCGSLWCRVSRQPR